MTNHRIARLLLASATIAFAAPVGGTPPRSNRDVISRDAIFGNPAIGAVKLSPDGRFLAWTAPRDGVLNIWIAPATDISKARTLTSARSYPIRSFSWSQDSSQILYELDEDGNEKTLVYAVAIGSGTSRLLTPFAGAKVSILATSRRQPGQILVSANNRDRNRNDALLVDIASGTSKVVFENRGYDELFADGDMNVRAVSRLREDGGADYFRVTGMDVEPTPFLSLALDDLIASRPSRFSRDGKTLYLTSSKDRDTAALVALDFATGATRQLGASEQADVVDILYDPVTGQPEAYKTSYLKPVWAGLTPQIQADLDFLAARLGGSLFIRAQSGDDATWIVEIESDVKPGEIWRFSRKGRSLQRLFVTRPALIGKKMAAMKPLVIESRDGLKLVSYLSLPPGTDKDGDGLPDKPLPLVLRVHGGPWMRNEFGYYNEHQWLANRGYAVLSVNYRASSGFGKRFIAAANKQWARTMQDDLIDGIDWAIKRGVTTRDRIAIMGGSYGGYATLVGMTRDADRFRCGVDIVGPSDLITLYNSFPPHIARLGWKNRMGDPAVPEERAMLIDRSPLTHVDQVRQPILISQGANDPRVTKAQSDSFVAAVQRRGVPITYILFPDEGHLFARPANDIAFRATAEHFLQRCLGGRVEPFGDVLTKSSMRVIAGGQFVPGLTDAAKDK